MIVPGLTAAIGVVSIALILAFPAAAIVILAAQIGLQVGLVVGAKIR